MPNRLINETSPYLLQHAHNPVDWYPWGDEAFAKARSEDKPVMLSIGYSACHWCHVMEHESFEDEATAALMNEHFVSIKVDREERPDLDQIYMTAVQGLTGRGGWPMTVFLTPDGKPFYGGTYYPPEDRMGMPGFRRVLQSISDAYGNERGNIDLQASRITAYIQEQTLLSAPADSLEPSILDDAFGALATQFDAQRGGFGGAPKFPQAMALDFLFHFHHRTGSDPALEIVEHTLQRMAAGGIYDQIGGGFHRYSVDDRWLVPHFEKMLYDNALLARCFLHAHQVTGNGAYRRVVEETLDYVRREMQHPEGGFFSTQDADSEGEEGKYYVWTPAEVAAALGSRDDAATVAGYFGVSPEGNFEGKTILTAPADPYAAASRHGIGRDELDEVIARARQRMLERRSTRVPPARDDKILSAWNGLMLRSFAEAARVLRRTEDLAAAEANARFLTTRMWRDGKLYRVHKDGATRVLGFLEDYAGVADGLLTLYQTTFDVAWFEAARDIVDAMIRRFWDNETEAFFDTATDAESLVARPRDIWDNATPSGTSLAAHALLTLWGLTGESEYERIARTTLASLATGMRQHPVGLGNLLSALARYLAPPQEVAIVGESTAATRALVDAIQPRYLPDTVVAVGTMETADLVPLLAGRASVAGRAAAYVCRSFVCELPVTEPEKLLEQLRV